MKDHSRVFSLVLSLVMAAAMLSSCDTGHSGPENDVTSAEVTSSAVMPAERKETTSSAAVSDPVTSLSASSASETTVSETSAPASETTSVSSSAETSVPPSEAAVTETAVSSETTVTTVPTTVSKSETTTAENSSAETTETFSEQVFTHDTEVPETETAEKMLFSEDSFSDASLRPYSYGFLNEKQLYIYDAVITAINQKKTKVRFSPLMGVTDEDYKYIYEIIYNDECSMFYLDTKMQYEINSITRIVASANIFYLYSDEEIDRMKAAVDEEADKVIAMITPDMTEYDVVKLFFDYLAETVTYDTEEGEFCHGIYGVFVEKKAICGGYAKAFAYLCSKVGIKALTITGDADGVPHMWNMVRIDGKWYQIDPTYGSGSRNGITYVRNDYFCFTDETAARTRVVYEQNYEYPEAVSDECNYYVRNGLVAYSYDEVKEMLSERIIAAAAEKAPFADICCGSPEVYEEAAYNLFDRSRAEVLPIMENALEKTENKYECGSISFVKDSGALVIRIFLDYKE